MAVCVTPDLGRIKAVGLFLLDDCMAPVYGANSGYVDDCPAAVATSDNIDDGEDFTRRCADGSLKRYLPGIKSLQSIEVNLDFHWLDPTFVALAQGASPIVHDGDVVGWGDGTNDRFNVLVVVWQELLGDDVCTDDQPCSDYVRMYPIQGARLTEDGDIGSEDNVIRLTGETVDYAQLGSGPIPLMCDGTTGDAEWPTTCFPSGEHRYRFIGGPVPADCGVMDTEEPDSPCTPGS